MVAGTLLWYGLSKEMARLGVHQAAPKLLNPEDMRIENTRQGVHRGQAHEHCRVNA